jgi:Icc-related predicted phosphoesterase
MMIVIASFIRMTSFIRIAFLHHDCLLHQVPPRGVLDKCYNGDRAGSRFLRDMLASSLLKPRVWLCGHIHEGFGCADCMLIAC